MNDQVEVTVVSFGKDVCCFKEVFGQSADVILMANNRFVLYAYETGTLFTGKTHSFFMFVRCFLSY